MVQYMVLPPILLSFVIALRPSAPWRLLTFLLICCISLRGITFTMGDAFQDYVQGTSFAVAAGNAMHFLLLSDPMTEYRHESDVGPPVEKGLLGRMYWATSLQQALRGVGWNYKVRVLRLCIF